MIEHRIATAMKTLSEYVPTASGVMVEEFWWDEHHAHIVLSYVLERERFFKELVVIGSSTDSMRNVSCSR